MQKTCKNGHEDPERYKDRRCKNCARERERKWRAANPEYARKRHAANPEKQNNHTRKWAAANPAKLNAKCAHRRAKKLRATPAWADKEKIRAVYKEAKRQQMHVDHIVPLKNKMVCGLHCEDNLQLLTPVENIKKSNRFPHTHTHNETHTHA